MLYLLRKLRLYTARPFLLSVYQVLFQTHVIYSIVIWGHSSAALDILLFQKRALGIISLTGHLHRSKCVHDLQPVYLQCIDPAEGDQHEYNTT